MRTGDCWFEPQAGPIFFPRVDEGHRAGVISLSSLSFVLTMVMWKSSQCLKEYCAECWLTLPNDKMLDWSILKAFADDKFKVAKMIIFVFDRVENIVGKRRKCCYMSSVKSFKLD